MNAKQNPFDFEQIRRESKDIAASATLRRHKGLRAVALALLVAVVAMLVAVAASIQTLPRAGLDYEGMSIPSQQAALAQLAEESSR